MACPFFMPRERMGEGPLDPEPRLPLGAAWSGVCTAPGEGKPTESEQREICNVGYARGRCQRFPREAEADAIRFSAVAGGVVFVFEKNHAPLRHGSVGRLDVPASPLREQIVAFGKTGHRASWPAEIGESADD